VIAVALGSAPYSPAAAPGPIREARRTALRDAYRRLAELRLPPATHPVRKIGRGLHLNGPGTEPDSPNLVQLHSYFLSPWPREKVVSWFKHHPPAGSGLQMIGSFGIGKKTVVRYIGFEWPERRGVVGSREVSIGIAGRPHGGTAIRADSQAVWVTPRRAGEQIPAGARFLDLKVRRPGGHLLKSRVISELSEVRSIADLIDSFGVVQPGTHSCPLETGPEKEYSLTFRHSRRGPILAEATQLTPGFCINALQLTVHGKKQPALEEGWLLLKRLRPLLAEGSRG